MSPKDAWNCTLSEFMMIRAAKDKKPIREIHEEADFQDAMDNSDLKDIYRARSS